MREIRFRAWSSKTEISGVPKGMYFNCGISFNDCGMNIEFENKMVVLDNWKSSSPAHFFEIMQFTGLKDINDIHIYEGDIICFCECCENTQCNDVYHDGGKKIKEVEFFEGEFQADGTSLRIWGSVEVLGNIYQNPQLLDKPPNP